VGQVALLINMFCEVTELNTYLSVMSLLSIISCTVSEIKKNKKQHDLFGKQRSIP